MTTEEALLRLAESTGEAVCETLRVFSPDGVEAGRAAVVPAGTNALDALPVPAVAAGVSYVDGVTGGNLLVVTLAGARRLAAAMMGSDPPEDDAEELDELELSAVGEAMNQMMAAAAMATSRVLGTEVEISPPETRVITSADDAHDLCESAPHATATSFSLLGESCRLVQLVPTAFTVRMEQALEQMESQVDLDEGGVVVDGPGSLRETIREVPVRVWAEIGRRRLPVGRIVDLPPGEVVELDRAADDPVDLYVNGAHFARGRLVVDEAGDWAVRLEQLFAPAPAEA